MDKRKLLMLSIILTSGLHQKLMEVSAQEETSVEPKVETSTEAMTPVQEFPVTDTPVIEKTSVEVSETSSIKNTSSVLETTVETTSETITLSEVESVMGEAVIDVVNNLREINGLNRLNQNDALTKAAKELVALKPISDEFKETYGDAHAQDQVIADKHGYQSDFTPANHLHLEVKLSDYQGKSLTEIASQFVNKWYLDMSNPDLAHRKQMLTKAWQETGIGVSIAPKFILGDLKNTNIKSKFGDVIVSKNTLELLDGFDIHISQYFGSTEAKKDYRYVDRSVSLPNYADYVESQIGQTEVNPMTGQEVTLDSDTARREIRRQRWDNYLGNQPEELLTVSVEAEIETKILNRLLSTKSSFNSIIIEDLLQKEILNKLNDELTLTEWSSPHTLIIEKDQEILGQWKLSPNMGQLALSPYIDNSQPNQSITNQPKIFETNEAAIEYGERVIRQYPDHYLTLVRMRDGKIATWFPEKQIMTEELKLTFNSVVAHQADILALKHDLAQIFKGFEAEIIQAPESIQKNKDLFYSYNDGDNNPKVYQLKISENTPIVYGDISLSEIYNDISKKYDIVWPIYNVYHPEDLDLTTPLTPGDFLTNIQPDKFDQLITSYREPSDMVMHDYYTFLDIPYNALYINRTLYLEQSFPSAKKLSRLSHYLLYWNQYLDLIKENKPELLENDYFVLTNLSNIFTKNYYDTVKDTLDKSEALASIQKLRDRYGDTFTIGIKREPYYFYPKWIKTENTKHLEGIFSDKNNIYMFSDEDSIIADSKLYNLYNLGVWISGDSDMVHQDGYHVYKMGDMYSVEYIPAFKEDDGIRYAYESLDQAITAAKTYVETNPKLFYDIFKVDDTYIVKYSENRIQTRWNPDNMYFDQSTNAEKFAQYIASQVREFDYEIIPDRIGYYRIQTNKILFKDDQDGLFLIPEYIGTGNSGSLGQNMTPDGLNLTDMYQEFRRKPGTTQPGTTQPVAPNFPIVDDQSPMVFAEDDKIKGENSGETKIHANPSNSNAPIKYRLKSQPQKSSHRGQANQTSVESRFSRVRFNPSKSVLEQIMNVIITDLISQTLDLSDEVKTRFDLFHHIELMFKDLSDQELSEPMDVQVLLYDGDDVEAVVLYDQTTEKDIESIDFEIKEVPVGELPEEFAGYDKTKIKGDIARILVYKITQSGDYGIQFKK